ncbi:non-specific lipid-transfer protein-like [Tripterygium wilfordii]|uniref:non-specific lipid-transfer protein-like n=1 Tax=Tripterygium wilfordii TaxID=458696 RepID=UPI0018F858E8|nr:non-specific lipid-transfer protein-like [Tripterygium wilfordii]
MQKQMVGRSMLVIGLLFLVVSAKAFDCHQSVLSLIPCLPFVIGFAPTPAAQCCVAVASLNSQANTKELRQELCNCFENSFKAYGSYAEKAKQIPELCHVPVPVPIDPNVDCSTIN